jgi:hypothetical protein
VSCEGDCEIIEQLGEKQDFETELTRLGHRHEDFTLHVLRSTARGKPAHCNFARYLVANLVV